MATWPVRRSNNETRAVAEQDQSGRAKGWGIAVLPSIGMALLPKLTCPVCWPAYTALLSSVGIHFIDYTPYLLPTLSAFLAITVWALAFRARSRRGYGPFGLGVLGAGAVLMGKFAFEHDAGVYAGAMLLVVASVWNLWPRSKSQHPSINHGVKCDETKTS